MVAAAMRPVAVETAAAKLMTLAAAAGASGGGGSVACSSCLVRGEPCEAGAAQLSSMVPRCAAISCGASGRAGAAASVVTSSASDHVQLSPPPSALTRKSTGRLRALHASIIFVICSGDMSWRVSWMESPTMVTSGY